MKFDTDPSQSIEENLTTVDSYSASRKQERETVAGSPEPATDAATTDDPAALEEEAESQGAFNPVTGEINWDCPCLGGMAHGPCGQEFRNAFSCFVYSEQEPKGLDCIDKFKAMQDCFRDHPDVYAAELEDDEAELDAELAKERESLNKEAAPSSADKQSKKRILDDEEPHALPISPILSADAPPTRREPSSAPKASSQQVPPQQAASHKDATSTSVSTESHPPPPVSTAASTKDDVVTDKPATKSDEESESVPKAWHDASDLNGKTTDEKKSK